jgi:hypothetical protein
MLTPLCYIHGGKECGERAVHQVRQAPAVLSLRDPNRRERHRMRNFSGAQNRAEINAAEPSLIVGITLSSRNAVYV